MFVTIKDVAKKANVSVATVSRVLNNKTNVSKEAVDAVSTAVRQLGYNPNFWARESRKSQTKRILAIISSMSHSFYSDVLAGMEQAAQLSGYTVLVATNNDDPAHEMRHLGLVFSHAVDGAVLLAPKLDAETVSGFAQTYNIAVCLERLERCRALTVTIDNVRAGKDAVNYLIGKGHKRVGMISTKTRTQSSIDRENGYKAALQESGLPFEKHYIYYGDNNNHESGVNAAAYFFSLRYRPTAIFCISDTIAIGAMSATASSGVNIGKDMMFFGFDNIGFSKIFEPHLSTVEQPCTLQGRAVIEKIIENISLPPNKRDNKLYKLPHSLILRETTGD